MTVPEYITQSPLLSKMSVPTDLGDRLVVYCLDCSNFIQSKVCGSGGNRHFAITSTHNKLHRKRESTAISQRRNSFALEKRTTGDDNILFFFFRWEEDVVGDTGVWEGFLRQWDFFCFVWGGERQRSNLSHFR